MQLWAPPRARWREVKPFDAAQGRRQRRVRDRDNAGPDERDLPLGLGHERRATAVQLAQLVVLVHLHHQVLDRCAIERPQDFVLGALTVELQ